MTFNANALPSAITVSDFGFQLLNREKTLTLNVAFALIVAVGIFAHWPALISDSIMWDDWIILAGITQSRSDWIFQLYHNYGVTPHFLVYFPFVAFTNDATTAILIAKVLYYSGVTISAVLIMLISRKITHGNLVFAILAGISAICYPALSGEGFHITTLNYYFYIPLFLTGILIFIEIALSRKIRLTLRLVALSALFLSFSLNSLLAMFYALLPAVFYAFLQDEKQSLHSLFINARVFLINYFDFLILPFIFLALKEIFMPRVGVYARYNKLLFDWSGIFSGYERLIPDILQPTLCVPFSIPFIPWIAASVFFIMVFGGQSILIRFKRDTDTTRTRIMILLGLGLLALFGAALPYYIVGRRSFQAFGFMSRDNVLFTLSISWITAALFCLLLQPFSFLQTYQSRRLAFLQQRIVLGAFASLIVSQSLFNWRNHADWQAHYAYYRSAMEKIVQDTLVNRASVIQVIDHLPGDRTLLTYKYPTSIWTEIISDVFQKTTRLAIPFPPANGRFFTQDEISQRIRETEVDFMLQDINLDGEQIRLTIEPASDFQSPIRLALAYWKARFFYPAEMPNLLDSLTRVKSERIESK